MSRTCFSWFIVLSISSAAQANAWKAEFGLSSAADLVAQEGGTLRLTTVRPQLTAELFLHSLADDHRHPLGLLYFYDRGGDVYATVGEQLNFSSSGLSSTQPTSLTVGGSVYPVHDFGLHGSGGFDLGSDQTSYGFSAGAEWYPAQTMDVALDYVMTRENASVPVTSNTGTDGARLSLIAVLGADLVALNVSGELRHIGSSATLPSGWGVPNSGGAIYGGALAVTVFPSREVFFDVEGGLYGESTDSWDSSGATFHYVVSQPYVAIGSSWCPVDAFTIGVRYEHDWVKTTYNPGSVTMGRIEALSLALGLKV